MSEAVLVHVVDDDAEIRAAVAMLLGAEGYRVREHADGVNFLDAFEPDGQSVVLMDVRMPGLDGLAVQQNMDERGWRLPLVFVSGHGDIPMAIEAVRRGALDFLQKPFTDSLLLKAVRGAIEALPKAGEQTALEQALQSLTEREHEVMMAVCEGHANKVIARLLGVSPRTVEIHRSRVLHKLDVQNAQQLVRRLMAAGKLDERGPEAPSGAPD